MSAVDTVRGDGIGWPRVSREQGTVVQRPTSYVLAEVSVLFLLASVAISAFVRIRGIPFIQNNVSGIAAVLFLYLPALLIWQRKKELSDYGFVFVTWRRSLFLYFSFLMSIFPIFIFGYWVLVHYLCPSFHIPPWLFACRPEILLHLRWPPNLEQLILGQVLVVALPEEFFFRGYIQTRLEEVFPPSRALVLAALLFALGHWLVSFQASSLAVFFPGLVFGLLRFWSGSIVAGALFHASCNVLIDVLYRTMG